MGNHERLMAERRERRQRREADEARRELIRADPDYSRRLHRAVEFIRAHSVASYQKQAAFWRVLVEDITTEIGRTEPAAPEPQPQLPGL